jgi:hypothetical protein
MKKIITLTVPDTIRPAHKALIDEVVGHLEASLGKEEAAHLLDLFSCERCKTRQAAAIAESEMYCKSTSKPVLDCSCSECRTKRRNSGQTRKDLTKVRKTS